MKDKELSLKLTHGSLFSGIGGFDLAAEWAGWENAFHCEWNEFGQKVLKHYWPNAISYGDITTTDFTIWRGKIDVLSGGFPCQPYSLAGKRLGKEDERHLWPEMLRAIQEIQPTWVVGENVFGIINWGGDWYSMRCKLTWRLKGTKYNRMYFHLQVSTLPTAETECGLLPTPAVMEDRRIPNENEKRTEKIKSNLNAYTITSLLPTPTAMDCSGATANMKSTQVKEGSMHSVTLSRALNMGLIPTPTANDSHHSMRIEQPSFQHRLNRDYMAEVVITATNPQPGKTSQLNPRFVMEMMGFPADWTLLPFLSGEQKASRLEATQ